MLEDATICHIPADRLRNVLSHSPALGLAFLARGADDLTHADTMNLQQALQSVRIRLIHLFLSLKDKHGSADNDGNIQIDMPMSWHDAAEFIGARPETVSRTIQALTQEGMIEVAGRQVKIADQDRLADEIEAVEI